MPKKKHPTIPSGTERHRIDEFKDETAQSRFGKNVAGRTAADRHMPKGHMRGR